MLRTRGDELVPGPSTACIRSVLKGREGECTLSQALLSVRARLPCELLRRKPAYGNIMPLEDAYM